MHMSPFGYLGIAIHKRQVSKHNCVVVDLGVIADSGEIVNFGGYANPAVSFVGKVFFPFDFSFLLFLGDFFNRLQNFCFHLRFEWIPQNAAETPFAVSHLSGNLPLADTVGLDKLPKFSLVHFVSSFLLMPILYLVAVVFSIGKINKNSLVIL
jgi:hypothetical protein